MHLQTVTTNITIISNTTANLILYL